MAYHDTDYFYFKLNLIIIQLEHIVDWVMVPLNRDLPRCNHICLCGKALMRSIVVPRWCLKRAKVMGARYPDQVGGHKPCVPVVGLCARVSPCGTVYVLATTVVVVSLVDTGPPRTSLVGSGSEWPGECHDNRSVLSERRWSTRMGVRGHRFHGVGIVY